MDWLTAFEAMQQAKEDPDKIFSMDGPYAMHYEEADPNNPFDLFGCWVFTDPIGEQVKIVDGGEWHDATDYVEKPKKNRWR